MANGLDKMQKDFKDLAAFFEKLPKQAANKYKQFVNNNFKEQGYNDETLEKWPARAKQDKSEKKRSKRALLVKSGALRRSIDVKVVKEGNNWVLIASSDVKYAQIHNEGLTVSYSAKVRTHQRTSSKGKRYKVSAYTRKVNFKMPKRQFMGVSAAFDAELIEYVEQNIENILK